MRARWPGPSERIGTTTSEGLATTSVSVMPAIYGFPLGSAAHPSEFSRLSYSCVGERPLNGHCSCSLDTVQYEAGLAVLDGRVFEQSLHDESAVVGHVLDHDPQQIV